MIPIPILCLAALTTTADPATSEPRGGPSPEIIFIAPMGISIPVNHNGLAFMVDTPNVAIEVFEADARIDLAPLATLSEIGHLNDVTITRNGAVAALTLNLPRFAIIEGQFKVRYLTIHPDGTTEFATANAKEASASILLTQDRATNQITILPVEDAGARTLTLTNVDGAIRIHVAPAPPAAE